MKKITMRIILQAGIFAFFFLNVFTAGAQQFDWVKGGGTNDSDPNLDIHAEATYYTCTDPNGNIYALSIVGSTAIYADTFYKSGAYGSDQNILLTSYNCTGQMRWAKLIASSAGPSTPYGITADSTGHIYITAALFNGTLHIGNAVSITGQVYQRTGLIQFDTMGNFNWVQYVGANTMTTYTQTGNSSALALDGVGNAHLLTYMGSGVVLIPGDTSHYGEYDLTYSAAGTLLSAKRLGMDSVYYVGGGVIDPATGKLYVYGQRNQGTNPLFLCYAAAFDTSRNTVWLDTAGNNSTGLGGIIYDRMGHLYFNGAAGDSFSFNGISVSPGTADILKTDTNGHPIWLQSFHILGSSVIGTAQITLLPNNLIAGTGVFAGTMTDANGPDYLVTTPGEGQNPFLTLLDTSGVVMTLQQIHGDGFYDWGLYTTSDRVGNVYIGGQVADSIYAGGITPYVSVGGNTDFFVMKYGMDCDCTSMPVANYTDTGAHYIKGFTYTGTTTGIDSVVWHFGDTSANVTGMSALHTYDSGVYEACVYVYSPCGMDMHCSRIQVDTIPTNVVNVITANNVQVYPNPAQDVVNVKTVTAGMSYRLLTITGVSVGNGLLAQGSNNVSLHGLAAGIYILEMKSADGGVQMVRVVKE